LITPLRFIEAMDTQDVFAPIDPRRIFEKMQRDIPNLTPVDLVFAGGVASQLGKQCRGVSWRLRGKRKLPKPAPARLGRRTDGPDDPD